MRANRQFRVTFEGNRYSVPARFAGAQVTLKAYPQHLCVYHDQELIARHVRSYERNRDLEDPDHAKALVTRRLKAARLPGIKTLDGFDWSWPKKINRAQVQQLFRLDFLSQHGNVIRLGGVGVGKTHLAIALAHAACLQGQSALFTSAVDSVNALAAAQATGGFKRELARLLKPTLLVVDELGYLPIDKFAADGLFQVISQRYRHGSTVITTNRAFKQWPEIFNNDSTLTSALLDRLLHHAESVVIEGPSYRMRDQSDA